MYSVAILSDQKTFSFTLIFFDRIKAHFFLKIVIVSAFNFFFQCIEMNTGGVRLLFRILILRNVIYQYDFPHKSNPSRFSNLWVMLALYYCVSFPDRHPVRIYQ